MTFRKEVLAEGIELYNADCREVLPTLPDVHLVATDPPFIGLEGGLSYNNPGVAAVQEATITIGDEWCASTDWVSLAWERSTLGMIVFCTYHSVDIFKHAIPQKPVGLVTWHKPNAQHSIRNVPRPTTELIWLWQKAPGLDWRAINTSMISMPFLQAGCMATERVLDSNKKAAHPTQKPVALMEWLLGAGGETVLDPFMGSGTTGVACVKLGRKFIGIEIEPKYFDIACKRISEALKQPDFFVEKPKPAKQEALL